MPNYRRNITEGGIYFFTLVIQDRKQDLLTRYITELKQAFKEAEAKYPFEIIAIVILPDHLHLLIRLPENDANYAIRLGYLKTKFTQKLPIALRNPSDSQLKKGEAGIWQRRYWEHFIRDEKDLEQHIHYIYYNPVKHGYVRSVYEWKYSSFHRDVENGVFPKDWGSNVITANLYVWD